MNKTSTLVYWLCDKFNLDYDDFIVNDDDTIECIIKPCIKFSHNKTSGLIFNEKKIHSIRELKVYFKRNNLL